MSNARVLLVAYHFPPVGGSGVQRAVKLAKYWPDCGIDLHVLTAGHAHYPLLDASLLNDVDPRVTIHRICGLDPGGLARRLIPGSNSPDPSIAAPSRLEQRIYWRLQSLAERRATPEPEAWWVGAAVRAARRIIRRHGIDVVVTTSPPHSVHRVGLRLRQSLGLPWVADLRDPIVDNFAYAPRRRAVDREWQRIECEVAANADRIVVTCDDYAEFLTRKLPQTAGRIDCITNGYDEADRPTVARNRACDRFTIAHVGAFYDDQSIAPILSACRGLRSTNADFARSLVLRLVGSISRRQIALLVPGDDAFVQRIGYLRHANAVGAMASANALFLMTPPSENGRLCIPAKTFEYLAFGRRLVALVHRGSSLDRLLNAAGVRDRAYHDDPDSLSRALLFAFRAWRCNEAAPTLETAFISEHRRDHIAARYAQVIASLVPSPAVAASTTMLEAAPA